MFYGVPRRTVPQRKGACPLNGVVATRCRLVPIPHAIRHHKLKQRHRAVGGAVGGYGYPARRQGRQQMVSDGRCASHCCSCSSMASRRDGTKLRFSLRWSQRPVRRACVSNAAGIACREGRCNACTRYAGRLNSRTTCTANRAAALLTALSLCTSLTRALAWRRDQRSKIKHTGRQAARHSPAHQPLAL